MKKHNFLTIFKIIVCCLAFFCIPALTDVLSRIAESRTIALTVSISTSAMFLIFANHQLAALHFKRFLQNLKENLVYVVFSAVFVCAAYLLSKYFFQFQIEHIDLEILKNYPFFAPLVVITYTFSYAFCYNILFKLITDYIPIHSEPLVTILLSGVLFTLYLSTSQFALVPLLKQQFDSTLYIKGLIANFFPAVCCSYCYNQTRSVVPMTLGLSLASLIMMFI